MISTMQATKVGDRVEIPAYCDAWMRGARYGKVTGIKRTQTAINEYELGPLQVTLRVRMDHSGIKRSQYVPAFDCKKV